MRILTIGALAIFAIGCAERAPEADEGGAALQAPEILNLADDFAAFWDATTGQQTPERVDAFKREVASQFPDFYGVERFEGRITEEKQNERISKAIEQFPDIRGAYHDKAARFDADLVGNIASFTAAFPGLQLSTPVVLLHSLGELDGGPREFNGEVFLVFGVDIMARVHNWDDESAFFHHELFHIHHGAYFKECEEVWCALWGEGLAVYVASQLNPGASEPQLLLEYPDGMAGATRGRLEASLAHLKAVLASTDDDVYSALFNAKEDETGLPPRRGYYLGFLVAGEIGRSRDLAALAALPNDAVRPLIDDAVDALLARSGPE